MNLNLRGRINIIMTSSSHVTFLLYMLSQVFLVLAPSKRNERCSSFLGQNISFIVDLS